MKHTIKDQQAILEKLGITSLNPMQEEALSVIGQQPEVMLLSPTGTGKTLAFLLPILAHLDRSLQAVQLLILTPSRELALQIEQVAREMGSGLKVNAVYGGRRIANDKEDLRHPPAVLIGTPGRVADHFQRRTFSPQHIRFVVLDEFDKSLEIGFTEAMSEILTALPPDANKVLTSATKGLEIPDFVGLQQPVTIDYLDNSATNGLAIQAIVSPDKDKLPTLLAALKHIGDQPGLIFCNFRDAIERVSAFLTENGVPHGCFHGAMEQFDRERALVQFRNGTYQLLLATDLAARGIDVPEIQFIIHYHLPTRAEEFTHRNGRTARMKRTGTAYVLHWDQETLPDFIGSPTTLSLTEGQLPSPTGWTTLFLSGGRRDKISKADIAGLFFKQGQLKPDELGLIELKQDCSFVAVPSKRVKFLLRELDNYKLKKRKLRVTEV
ncbi:MAG: DEAD/DEAH box helicase [Saprospiraceae bacterium]